MADIFFFWRRNAVAEYMRAVGVRPIRRGAHAAADDRGIPARCRAGSGRRHRIDRKNHSPPPLLSSPILPKVGDADGCFDGDLEKSNSSASQNDLSEIDSDRLSSVTFIPS
jgi:hypothetical protein